MRKESPSLICNLQISIICFTFIHTLGVNLRVLYNLLYLVSDTSAGSGSVISRTLYIRAFSAITPLVSCIYGNRRAWASTSLWIINHVARDINPQNVNRYRDTRLFGSDALVFYSLRPSKKKFASRENAMDDFSYLKKWKKLIFKCKHILLAALYMIRP